MSLSTKRREDILAALDKYDKGIRPPKAGQPKRYWIVHPDTGKLYPLKTIVRIATNETENIPTSNDNMRRQVSNLGFEWIDTKQPELDRDELEDLVSTALSDSAEERKSRLENSNSEPQKSKRTIMSFRRNPDVIAQRLSMAAGVCEACHKPAPFISRRTGRPFLEVHHDKPLSEGGEDTVENTLALCPNCHRKAHFG